MLCTMSNRSYKVCESIIQTDLHSDMLRNLGWETLSAASLNDPGSCVKRRVSEVQINTLHNVVRKAETARGAMRKCQAVDVLQKFRDVTEFPVLFSFVFCHVLSMTNGENLKKKNQRI